MKDRAKVFYLIGFMASGKSTLASATALDLDWTFADMDQLIADKLSLSISDIFKSYGEPYFRYLEAQFVRSSIFQDHTLCALGGGAPMHYNTMDYLRRTSQTIFVQIDFDIIYQRLTKNPSDRPLVDRLGKAGLKGLFDNRQNIYNQADFILKDQGSLEANKRELMKILEK